MIGVELEENFIDTIQHYCRTEEDKIEAKRYFESYLINDLIDSALKE